MNKITVFLVDDSAVIRQVLGDLIDSDPEMQVIGSAPDPLLALRKMNTNWPDVILLDIQMPKLDGISFLKEIMSNHPTPVVICSALIEDNPHLSIEALSSGAIEVINKPQTKLTEYLCSDKAKQITMALKNAAKTKVRGLKYLGDQSFRPQHSPDVVIKPKQALLHTDHKKVIVIGASTGGTEAIGFFLNEMPKLSPPIVIVQHMPPKFTAAFAQRLNQQTPHQVVEAKEGMELSVGQVYIAPGGVHTILRYQNDKYFLELKDGPLVSRHKPSVDVLFRSAAQVAGNNAIGVILTGMGGDGAQGMLELKQAGGVTFAQDEETSLVFGMPKEAIAKGGVKHVYSLTSLPYHVQHVLGDQ